jgi:hypothetical protein
VDLVFELVHSNVTILGTATIRKHGLAGWRWNYADRSENGDGHDN